MQSLAQIVGERIMQETLAKFIKAEDGAVTVDWVVLTGAIVGLGIAVISTVAQGALDNSDGIGAALASSEIPDYSSGN